MFYFIKIKTSGKIGVDELLNLSVKGLSTFNLFLIFCEFGEQMSGLFGGIYEQIFSLDWYTYPVELQRIMPVILMNSQKPVVLKGFGNVPVTRLNFKSVNLHK